MMNDDYYIIMDIRISVNQFLMFRKLG